MCTYQSVLDTFYIIVFYYNSNLYLCPQLKELRTRVVDMEGQTRSSAGVSQLENKILELEERLRSEER